MNSLRLVGAFGANRAMEAELKRLGPRAIENFGFPKPRRLDQHTLLYPFDPELAWMAVHYMRTPSRVIWDLYECESVRLEPLYEEIKRWIRKEDRAWLKTGRSFSIRVNRAPRFEAGPLQIRGTIKNGLIDGAPKKKLRLDPEAPDLTFVASEDEQGKLHLGLDLLGHSMHLRGYRLEEGPAPLKESLAAQMLILARWDARSEALIDPMSGAGTLAAEAALMATGEPLRPGKKTTAERLGLLPQKETPALFPLRPGTAPLIIANELHTPTHAIMCKNLERAGVKDRVVALHGDFRNLTQRRLARDLKNKTGASLERGLIVCNPPYGERLGSDPQALKQLYQDLRSWCFSVGSQGDWRAAFFVTSPDFERIFGVEPRMKKPMRNGALKIWLLVYDLHR